ncbi:short-chain fatty acid transporter [Aureitalea marina]|uniref:Short-chain fatty acid transporter n=1 Tax=Aureitalea marina TaxID=930804 RepID=A0A2S7KT97_9FLAO|nr:TIGR00366 family protein [Aureitalea marina]PQB05808.1 short-chain fatty acid transporter [Aureitalea marina]
MSVTRTIETIFRRFLPSPFAIAVILTLVTMVLAYFFTPAPETGSQFSAILTYWEKGIWNNGLLVFAYQMMLILVLGHILVLSKPMNTLITALTDKVHNTSQAVVLVSISTMMVAFFNWGLGLIFGAILARKVAEASQQRGFAINYPMIGAAGYAGMMIWHGGISGSAPAKVAETGHLAGFMEGVGTQEAAVLPDLISYSQTVFSGSNLLLFGLLLVLIPAFLWWLSKKSSTAPTSVPIYSGSQADDMGDGIVHGADRSRWLCMGFGVLVLIAFGIRYAEDLQELAITPNLLNFFMFGLALILHGSFRSFLNALEEAIRGASGILIQFPLYFGIMGIMRDSGMIVQISDFFVSIATPVTMPIFTFFSAGLVNLFVPSGGGQWAVQGPIVVESALQLGVPLPKAIMALSYGDQITNMLQPFWALPLLGITRLKAREILPFTFLMMLVGIVVFLLGLWLL